MDAKFRWQSESDGYGGLEKATARRSEMEKE